MDMDSRSEVCMRIELGLRELLRASGVPHEEVRIDPGVKEFRIVCIEAIRSKTLEALESGSFRDQALQILREAIDRYGDGSECKEDALLLLTSADRPPVVPDTPESIAIRAAEDAVLAEIESQHPDVSIYTVERIVDETRFLHSWIFVRTNAELEIPAFKDDMPRYKRLYQELLASEFDYGVAARKRLQTELTFDSYQNVLENYEGNFYFYLR